MVFREKTAPAAPKTTALQGDLAADVVIVGGGFTGLSYGAASGRKACVPSFLKDRDRLWRFGRNVGLVNAGMWGYAGRSAAGVLGRNMQRPAA
ncbi:hypothetical protein VXQ18_03675 [Brucella abortus]|nr:hypothetical protein [Brucella abortus]